MMDPDLSAELDILADRHSNSSFSCQHRRLAGRQSNPVDGPNTTTSPPVGYLSSTRNKPRSRITLIIARIATSRIIFTLIHTLVLHIVLRKMIHVGFVEHRTNDSLMHIRCRLECMPYDVDLCTTPFDNQNHAVHQMSGCLGVYYWHKRRKINNNQFETFTQPINKLLHWL